MAKTRLQRSAGGVLYQEREGTMWVILIATKGGEVWGLPKGLVEKGEKTLQTAVREAGEESGVQGEPVADLGYIEYWYRDSATRALYHKFVHYYLLRRLGGDVGEHDWEVEEARWFPIDDAIEHATYQNEKGVLIKAKEEWSKLASDAD